MKYVVLSAEVERRVYSVPDAVAEDLKGYCLRFLDWLENNVRAQKFLLLGGLRYTTEDFIDYLNTRAFPEEASVFMENLGKLPEGERLPAPYTDCPEYHFPKGDRT